MKGMRSKGVMKNFLAIAGVSTMLLGCFPYVTSYVHLDAQEIGHLPAICRNVGPPVFATFEGNGLRFAVTLEPWGHRSKNGFLRVRAPHDTVVSIPEPFGSVTPTNQPAIRFELQGGMAGAFEQLGLVEYRFDFRGLPPIDFAGRLKLPTIIVNGAKVEPPVFGFERLPYAGIAPLNC